MRLLSEECTSTNSVTTPMAALVLDLIVRIFNPQPIPESEKITNSSNERAHEIDTSLSEE